MRIAILGGALLIGLAGLAEAKVYKWVDAEGGVHYSTHAPAQAKAQEIRVAPAPPGAGAAPEAGSKPDAAAAKPAAEEQATADTARAEAFKKNCEISRQNLKILEDPANRRFDDGKNGPVYYTDEQRATRIADTKKSIETYCNGPGKAGSN